MVMLKEQDIQTKEVLDWKGLHLLNFSGSSCSQKLRIALAIKNVDYTSREINLIKNENYSEWFMGINPRGLVPVLVDDGKVIIESNDILQYIEQKFPQPKLIPDEHNQEAIALLEAEDELHMDLRTLTMRFFVPSFMVKRSQKTLNDYQNNGAGTVNGAADLQKAAELKFFSDLNANNGITDEQASVSANKFKHAFNELETRLQSHQYLLNDQLSLIDIAWYIYSVRLTSAGYPLHRLHPQVGAWFDKLHALEHFNREVSNPVPLKLVSGLLHTVQAMRGTSLEQVAAL